MAKQFIIIADDSTGANDSAVQFVKRGYGAAVYFSDQFDTSNEQGIIVFDSDTRCVSAEKAYRKVKGIVAAANAESGILKKIDSTLRGNIGAELAAVLDERPGSVAFVVPAYPANGRTTVGGRQLLHGIPVHETEIGRDPKTPVITSDIAQLLPVESVLISTRILEQGDESLREEVEKACAKGCRAIIFDAETQEHVKAVAALQDSFRQAFYVGCAGIAAYLDPYMPQGRSTKLPSIHKPLLFILGSLSKLTMAQLCYFSGEDVYKVILDPIDILQSAEKWSGDIVLAESAKRYQSGKHLVIALDASEQARAKVVDFCRDRGLPLEMASNRLRESLAYLTSRLLSELTPKCFFASGGDTARSIIEKTRIKGLRVLCELEEGIPLCKVSDRPLYMITKAGAFGNEKSFRHIVKLLYQKA